MLTIIQIGRHFPSLQSETTIQLHFQHIDIRLVIKKLLSST